MLMTAMEAPRAMGAGGSTTPGGGARRAINASRGRPVEACTEVTRRRAAHSSSMAQRARERGSARRTTKDRRPIWIERLRQDREGAAECERGPHD